MKSGHAFRVSFPHLLVFILCCGYSNTQLAGVKQDDPHACFAYHLGERPVYRCCDGYFLNNSMCIECYDGRYGKDCRRDCMCQNGGICNKTEGSCECPQSYYGGKCTFTCPCQNGGTCNHDNDIFKSCTCKGGYYGNICENKCSCPDGIVCNSVTGCECKSGTWGVNCRGVCKCPTDMLCDIADGSCKCHPGFYGEKCKHQCHCFNGGECSEANPNVCVCPSTWRGRDCTDCNSYESGGKIYELCEDKCLHCYNGNDCRPQDKTCNCTPGWHGDRCDQPCETGYYGYNCSEKCSCESFERCNHETGECSCHPGYFGQSCDQICPENCLECKKDTGYCILCVTGWTGTNCEFSLPQNGNEINCTDVNGKCICTERCREHCTDGSCDPHKGYIIGMLR
ncbi:multiple epidermal growth factor-like domains protein 10 [Ptychodera flava]|uniref:multiple epidermal growth factor-like domains protein 10 n=1 Tax=Ptychodera flava TaxID=63121 RepID=UPI00396A5220